VLTTVNTWSEIHMVGPTNSCGGTYSIGFTHVSTLLYNMCITVVQRDFSKLKKMSSFNYQKELMVSV
jgi:hypothetical protein